MTKENEKKDGEDVEERRNIREKKEEEGTGGRNWKTTTKR
jgi:hypothetical protein